MSTVNKQRIQNLATLLEQLEREHFFGDVTLKLKDGQLVPHFEQRRVGDLDRPAAG